ncbi:MAG: SDR family oxidoreductase [Chloroflexi bacterium]|nr:SDR family oxidoreductase [Chloroflexota bacterium]
MSISLSGQIALVTGASRGIGAAIAKALASAGSTILLVARSEPDLRQVQQSIESNGGMAVYTCADASKEEDVRRALGEVEQRFGRLDILVNCAGIGVFGPLVSTNTSDWDRVMATNARGPFLFCRESVPIMARRSNGCIINIASVVGVKGYMNQGAYTASKHALMGMTKVLAQEVQPLGIRVHIICPGGVDTEMASQARPDLDRSGLITPEEVAEVVLFLVSQRGNAVVDQVNLRRANGAPWFSE